MPACRSGVAEKGCIAISTFTTRAPIIARRGAIGSSNYLATEAGLKMLRDGGNCIDAIIAAAAVLNVVEPYSSHLGGDCFLIHWDAAKRKLTAINSSGAAPRGMRPELFSEEIPPSGFLCSTVPGQVAGWDTALTELGTRSPGEVLQEAIYYAAEGHPVARGMADVMAGATERICPFPSTTAVFMPDGRSPRRGEMLRQPDLAWTLQTMAEQGFRAFYEGEIARRISDFWQSHGGVLDAVDLVAHRARIIQPLHVNYRGYDIYEQPPVSQGHILLQSLQMVERFDLAGMGHLSPEALHVCLEANKLAHADKNRYTTDPQWTPLPPGLLSPEYAAARAALIDMNQALEFPPPAGEPPAGSDTTYLCCVDGEGNAVSYIQSVFHGFGCGVVAEGTGVLLNNRGCGFSLDPAHANYLQPEKKTVHTLNTYMIFRDGRPVIVGGTPGGDVQVQTNLQVITGLLDFGRDAQQAAEDPRWARGMGREVSLEDRAPEKTFSGLTSRGHQVQRGGPYSQGGRVQVILIDDSGVLTAGSDPRCDGCALGF